MENAWYEEKWATDLMGAIASSVFAEPTEARVDTQGVEKALADLRAKTALGVAPEFGKWAPVIAVISIIALTLLFFFLSKGKRRR